MEKQELSCLRCGGRMSYAKSAKLQLGEAGIFLGLLPNITAGSLSVEIYRCYNCGKLELYTSQLENDAQPDEAGEIPQIKCPKCGKEHDFDYPSCPFCGYMYQ